MKFKTIKPIFMGSDLLSITRLYMLLTVVTLWIGRPLAAACIALFTVHILREEHINLQSSSSSSSKVPSIAEHWSGHKTNNKLTRWYLWSSMSVVASIVSWMLLLWSYRNSQPKQESTTIHNSIITTLTNRTWVLGFVLQQGWSILLGYLLYKDIELELPSSSRSSSSSRQDNNDTNGYCDTINDDLYEIRVRILQGRNLVPKDMASKLLGQPATSDPYVIVSLLKGPKNKNNNHNHNHNNYNNKLLLGKTSVIPKSLNPVWSSPRWFQTTVTKRTLESSYNNKKMILECQIMDRDLLKADDNMGTVYIPLVLPKVLNNTTTNAETTTSCSINNNTWTAWFPVQKGKGSSFCHNAMGELLVEMEFRILSES